MLPLKNVPDIYPPGRYREGQRVRFVFGTAEVEGVITEDRGPLGIDGRRVYRIEFRIDPEYVPDEVSAIELMEDEFTPID
jgi:hypothetical protein